MIARAELEWVRVTAAKPCPVCQHTKWCSVSPDGDLVCCMHEPSDRPTSDGKGWLHRMNADAPAKVIRMGNHRKPTKITSWEIVGDGGEVVAIHVRHDFEDGDKDVLWYGPDEKAGIKRLGLSIEDLPLYNLPALLASEPDRPVIVCEGEKATDALTSIGVLAVGTVTGADTVPSAKALAPLLGREVLLWPDNDEKGAKHMRGIAAALVQRDTVCYRLVWPEAPEKGDAADFVADGLGRDALNVMYADAVKRGQNDALLGPHANEHLNDHLTLNGAAPQSQKSGDHAWSPDDGVGAGCSPDALFPGALLMSEVRPRKVLWLWSGRIALGENTVLDGDPGLGKTMWLMDLCARITTGRDMPDGTPSGLDGPRGVVILNCEDAPDTSLAPRLEAAGADRSRIVLLQTVPTQDGEATFPEILRDLPWVEKLIKAVDAALVIVDPLVGFLGDAKEISANSDQDMRRVLNPFGALMRRYGTAGVVVRHLRKQAGGSALYRGSGSIAISATARGGLLVARDPHDRTKRRRILAVQKSNLAQEAPPLAYKIVQNAEGYPHVEWLGTADLTAEELLAEPTSLDELSKIDEAVDFLEEHLSGGPASAQDAINVAVRNGIDKATLRRGRLQLGITRESGCVYQRSGVWYWKLPEGTRARFYDENQQAAGRAR